MVCLMFAVYKKCEPSACGEMDESDIKVYIP